MLGSKTSADCEITVHMSRATSTNTSTAVICRVQSFQTLYRVRLRQNSLDLLAVVSGAVFPLASVSYPVTPGAYDFLHVRLAGSVLSANAWPDDGVAEEPAGWMAQATDTRVTGQGQFGLSVTLQSGDTASFDTFTVDNLLPPPALIPDNPYGYTILNKSPVSPAVLQDIASQGAAWVRPQTNWSLMEKTDDGSRGSTLSSVLNWSLMDDIVKKCNSLGLRCCLPIQNPPNWHCFTVTSPANRNPIQIPQVADTVAFAQALVTRYNGVTKNPLTGQPYGHIEAVMFNEDWDAFAAGWPGNGNPAYIGRDAAPLAPILMALYPFVKSVHPGCLVGSASLLGKRTDAAHIRAWVSSLYRQGAGASFDFLDVHFYNCAAAPSLPNNNLGDPPLPDRLAAIRAASAQYGYPEKDLWLTEAGYQVNNGGPAAVCDVSAAVQSANLQATMDIARTSGVTHLFLWTIGSNDNNSLTQGQGGNKTYMPAYTDLQTGYIPQYPQWNAASTALLALTDSIAQGLSDYAGAFASPNAASVQAAAAILADVGGGGPAATMGRLDGAADPLDRQLLTGAGSRVALGALPAFFAETGDLAGFAASYYPLLDALDQSALLGGLGSLSAWAATYTGGQQSAPGIFNARFVAAFNQYAAAALALGYRPPGAALPTPLGPTLAFPFVAVDPLYSFCCGPGTVMPFGMAYSSSGQYGGGQASVFLYKTNPGVAAGGALLTIAYLLADGTPLIAQYTVLAGQAGPATLASSMAVSLGFAAAQVTSVTGTGMTAGEQYSLGLRLVRPSAY